MNRGILTLIGIALIAIGVISAVVTLTVNGVTCLSLIGLILIALANRRAPA